MPLAQIPCVEMVALMALADLEQLEARNHSERENCIARRRCREFLEGGLGLRQSKGRDG